MPSITKVGKTITKQFLIQEPSVPNMQALAGQLAEKSNWAHRHDGIGATSDYAIDTGVANAYAIALLPAITAHIEGLPIYFKATNANTAASTLAVNGLAAVAIKQSDGSDLPAGAIVAGQMVTVIYTGAVYMLISGRGVATDAEVQAGTNSNKAITPSAMMAAFGKSLNTNGYQELPGGLIIQWGATSGIPAGSQITVTLPVSMPHEIFRVFATAESAFSDTTPISAAWSLLNASQFVLRNKSGFAAIFSWCAIGR